MFSWPDVTQRKGPRGDRNMLSRGSDPWVCDISCARLERAEAHRAQAEAGYVTINSLSHGSGSQIDRGST
jgi:hypothetical protein